MKAVMEIQNELMTWSGFETVVKSLDLLLKHHPDSYHHALEAWVLWWIVWNRLWHNENEKKWYLLWWMLHDIWKGVIQNAILNKPWWPSEKEFAIIQSHPLLTYLILTNNEQNVNPNDLTSDPVIFAAIVGLIHHDDLSWYWKWCY